MPSPPVYLLHCFIWLQGLFCKKYDICVRKAKLEYTAVDHRDMKTAQNQSKDEMDKQKVRNTRFGNGETHPVFYIAVFAVIIAALIFYYFVPINVK